MAPPTTNTTLAPAQLDLLQISYEVLARKYNKLDGRYKEAKRQVQLLKDHLEQKTEQWRQWQEWWATQKKSLRIKESSTSPAKKTNDSIGLEELEMPLVTDTRGPMDIESGEPDETNVEDSTGEDDLDDDEIEACLRRTYSSDDIIVRGAPESFQVPDATTMLDLSILDIQKTVVKRTEDIVPSDILAATRNTRVDKSKLVSHSTRMLDVQTTPTRREVIEIPESPEFRPRSVALNPIPRPLTPVDLGTSLKRPQSAPNPRIRTSRSSTPKSGKSTKSAGQRKKDREYPNMKYWTEDGTDGINKLPSSSTDDDERGPSILEALLEGNSPPPAKTTPISHPRLSTSKLLDTKSNEKTTSTKGRVRDLIEFESDSGRESNDSSTGVLKRQRINQVQSEPRPRRLLLSPDLAIKNKGRGRYATSMQQNPDGAPRLGDFVIDPKHNFGVSHAFSEVVRGKEARKSLPAAPCPDCVKFFELHGPVANAGVCKHTKGTGVQQHVNLVGKHRQIWHPEPKPAGYWDSDFPEGERQEEVRKQADSMIAEKTRQRAEEAAQEGGRWRRRNT